MNKHTPCRRTGFSIPEMLAVVAIAVIVLSMLMPSLIQSRRTANQVICANNLHQLNLTYRALRSDIGAKPLQHAYGWQGRLLPYMHNSTAMTLCPNDDDGSTAGGSAATSVYLEVWRGDVDTGRHLYDMDMEVGPWTRRVDKATTDSEIDVLWAGKGGVGDTIKGYRDALPEGDSYLLCFEDLRPNGGDQDFEDVIIQLAEEPTGVVLTFVTEGAGYNFNLKDRSGLVIWHDMDRNGETRPGATTHVDGSPSSYGMNTALPLLQQSGSNAIFMLDYERSVAEAGLNGLDPWNEWLNELGVPRFARHFGRANVAFMDGHVELKDTADIDPKIQQYREDLWNPTSR